MSMEKVLKSKEEYLESLIEKIEAKKSIGKKSIYLINENVNKDTVEFLRNTFLKMNYHFEARACKKIRDTYDLIIFF